MDESSLCTCVSVRRWQNGQSIQRASSWRSSSGVTACSAAGWGVVRTMGGGVVGGYWEGWVSLGSLLG